MKYCVENARRYGSQPAWNLPHYYRLVSAFRRWPGPYLKFVVLAAYSRACAGKIESGSTGTAHFSLGPVLGRCTEAPTPTIFGGTTSTMQHEELQHFFEALLNSKDHTANTRT